MILIRNITRIAAILAVIFTTSSFTYGQSTPYILTDFPITLLTPDSAVWIKWTGATRNPLDPDLIPDSGRVYFSTSPGGSVIENYTDSVTKRVIDTIISDLDTSYVSQNNILFKGNVPQRGIKFRPGENGMGTGIYYVMVAWKTKIGIKDTTFFSNEVKIIVETTQPTELTSPKNSAETDNLTPTFQWKNNPGVPYYHIIVSDEKIEPNMDSMTISGLSIIWEAITANTQMTYGEPDPSGTITADPPPLSPGLEYSWVVLNNYGNHPAYSSVRFGLPSTFSIKGLPLKKPQNTFPVGDTIDAKTDSTVTLRWTNLDSLANTYKLYIYVTSEFEGVSAQMVVWSKEITAGSFTGDTAAYTVNIKSILTDNDYTWKVIAVDKKGAGTSGDVTKFTYNAPTGKIRVYTKENINVGDTTLVKAVGLVEIKVEVLDGSLEAPLLFYTDGDGYLQRDRPAGTYRLSTNKDGFEPQTKTITVNDGDTAIQTFFLVRPDATVYGEVLDEAGSALNLAEVIGVSDRGDTVVAETDPLGNFILSCYEADWTIIAKKTGYETSLAKEISVTYGENYNFGDPIILEKFAYTLSGIVKNNSGEALLGVNVKLLLGGTVIGSVPSTPQNGTFSFSVEPGTYTLTAEKVGFTTYSSSLDILNSTQLNISLASGAALISGEVYGRSWDNNYVAIHAPITNATILIIDTTVTPPDTLTGTSGSVYGDFAISVEGGKTYVMYEQANGYVKDTSALSIITEPGKTVAVTDTLKSLATIKGSVIIGSRKFADLSGISISLVDTTTKNIVATSESDALGSFEIRNVPDSDPGSVFQIVAGRNGLVVDSIFLIDILGTSQNENMVLVNDGKAQVISTGNIITSISIKMKSGTKALQWVLKSGTVNITDALVKVQSPLVKNVTPSQGISGVGTGSYIMSIDAGSDSIIDCSYHTYTISVGSDSVNVDTVLMPLLFKAPLSLTPVNGLATFSLTIVDTSIDSAYIFYKDINAQTYDSLPKTKGFANDTLVFQVSPPKDGSYLEYYFKCYLNNDIYGYEQENYRTFINADSTTHTKIAVTPFAEDTLLLPADEKITFLFSGYYGSNYSPSKVITASNVSWKLIVPLECEIVSPVPATDVVIQTASQGTGTAAAVLQAVFIPSQGCVLKPGAKDTVRVPFRVSSSKLDSVQIVRVDAGEKEYLTTSGVDKAEFIARGIDKAGNAVTITSVWDSISPNIGTISNGIFTPARNFVGRARIGASIGKMKSEYYDASAEKYGISVHYLISSIRDTAYSDLGCQIIIPDSLGFKPGKRKELSLEIPNLNNDIFTSSTHDSLFGQPMRVKFDVIGKIFDIEDIDSAVLFDTDSLNTDSIVIRLDIPEEYRDDAQGGKVYMALWDKENAEWDPIKNSTMTQDGIGMSIRTTHFSRYTLVFNSSGTGLEKFKIKPNPFSPYVRPTNEYGIDAPNGTCIEIRAISESDGKLETIDLEIYNVVGDRVWSIIMKNALSSNLYRIWWDGKTTDKKEMVRETNMSQSVGYTTVSRIPTGRMCRNGRYFLVVRVKDSKKQKQYMKQIVLFK